MHYFPQLPLGHDREGFRVGILLVTIPAFVATGCDPVIGIAGASFPVWQLCLIVGVVASLLLRPLFVAVGIDEWMTPRPLVYSSLVLVIALLCWLTVWWRS
jgi:hypothetical protein